MSAKIPYRFMRFRMADMDSPDYFQPRPRVGCKAPLSSRGVVDLTLPSGSAGGAAQLFAAAATPIPPGFHAGLNRGLLLVDMPYDLAGTEHQLAIAFYGTADEIEAPYLSTPANNAEGRDHVVVADDDSMLDVAGALTTAIGACLSAMGLTEWRTMTVGSDRPGTQRGRMSWDIQIARWTFASPAGWPALTVSGEYLNAAAQSTPWTRDTIPASLRPIVAAETGMPRLMVLPATDAAFDNYTPSWPRH